MDDVTNDTGKSEKQGGLHDVPRWVIAIGTLGVYLVLQISLWLGADALTDKVWERRISILTALEFIVFAGIGWAFGREVGRDAAAEAAKQAEIERERAAESDSATKEKTVQVAEMGTKLAALYAIADGSVKQRGLTGTDGGQRQSDSDLRTQILAIINS